MVTDPDHATALETSTGQRFTATDVAFGGPYGNVLFISIGADRKASEELHNSLSGAHTHGGLYKLTLNTQGAWVTRFGYTLP